MKHYECYFLFALSCLLVSCSGRLYRHGTSNQAVQMDGISNTVHTSGLRSEADVNHHTQTDGEWFRIAWTFDTSKPIDSITNLPPISGVTIEGKKEKKEEDTQINNTTSINDSTATNDTARYQEDIFKETKQSTDGGLMVGADEGIKWGIILTVIGLLIITGIIVYVRKKNPSK